MKQLDRVLGYSKKLYGFDPVLATEDNPDISDDKWGFVVDMVGQEIKNYCNIKKIPKELEYTWANMNVDYMRYWLQVTGSPEGQLGTDDDEEHYKNVRKLTVGETSVHFHAQQSSNIGVQAGLEAASNSHVPDLDAILLNYVGQLNAFRRMRWK